MSVDFVCPVRIQGNRSFKCTGLQLQKIVEVAQDGKSYFVCPNPKCRGLVARDTLLHTGTALSHEAFEAKLEAF